MSRFFALDDIPEWLDLSSVKCNVGHVLLKLASHARVQYHAGTNLPKSISGLGPLADGFVVYRQEWHCCGAYGCTSGNGKNSARRKCGAVAIMVVESTGVEDEFRVRFDEPDEIEHGDDFEPPADTPPRTLYRTKVLLAQAALDGLSYNEFNEQRLPEQLKPVGWKATKTLKRRFQNLAQATKKAKTTRAPLPPPPPPPLPPPPQPLASASAAVGGNGSQQDGTDSDDGDVDAAAAALLGDRLAHKGPSSIGGGDGSVFEALLASREAVPWTELRSVEDALEELSELGYVRDQLDAINLDGVGGGSGDDDDDEADTDVEIMVRADGMFCAGLVDRLLGDPTKAAVRERFLAQVLPPSADCFAATAVNVDHWAPASISEARLVPKNWHTDKLAVGNSTAAGQCLFSSVALLVYDRRDDDVALWLRTRCVFELLEHWQMYCRWFSDETAREMLDSLVGENQNSQKYGFKWPIAEVLWLLANVLQRRIVVARKLRRETADTAGGALPFVVLPARHRVEEWDDAAPLVVLHLDANHYKPVAAQWIDAALRALPFAGDLLTQALNDALAPLVGVYCTKPAASFSLQ
jgi:hypothetical protein